MGVILLLRMHLAVSGDISYRTKENGALLASSALEARVMLNILQYTGQCPTTNNHPVQNDNGAQDETDQI